MGRKRNGNPLSNSVHRQRLQLASAGSDCFFRTGRENNGRQFASHPENGRNPVEMETGVLERALFFFAFRPCLRIINTNCFLCPTLVCQIDTNCSFGWTERKRAATGLRLSPAASQLCYSFPLVGMIAGLRSRKKDNWCSAAYY